MHPLLTPRYKVIAPWPDGNILVGTILKMYRAASDWIKAAYKESAHSLHVFYGDIDNYPHLFRLLNWWEDRKESELPEYVKTKQGTLSVKKVGKIHDPFVDFSGGGRRLVSHWLPATESEYLTFINSKK